MKIALSGYGRMGHEIEKALIQRGHTLVTTIDRAEEWETRSAKIADCEVVIDFSTPEAAALTVEQCSSRGIPLVSGTTGWTDGLKEAIDHSKKGELTFFYAPNFSIGMNIFFAINQRLASLMNQHADYSASVHEIHHIHKKDVPSGTAIALANQLIKNNPNYISWHTSDTDLTGVLPVSSERVGEVPGTHHITWQSPADTIEIIHTAHNRQGFALGAVMAAEWVVDKKGFFEMSDMLGFIKIE